jgi:hypothetical protein
VQKNLDKKPAIIRFLALTGEIEFTDGTVSPFDHVVFCTEYRYDYGFTRNSNGPMFDGDFSVRDIYEHLFYIPQRGDPSLSFVGIPKMSPWAIFEAQAAVIARVFAGRAPSPSRPEMQSWEKEAVANWNLQCTIDKVHPSLDIMFHSLNLYMVSNMDGGMVVMMIGDRQKPTSTVFATGLRGSNHGSLSIPDATGPKPPFWCKRMEWIRGNVRAVRNLAMGNEVDPRDKLLCLSVREYGFDFDIEPGWGRGTAHLQLQW